MGAIEYISECERRMRRGAEWWCCAACDFDVLLCDECGGWRGDGGGDVE